MSGLSQPWQIAMDIEKLARAVDSASFMLRGIDPKALSAIFAAAPEISAIDGEDMFRALMMLADKYQAIADAEPDERAEMETSTGFREEDFA